MRLDYLGSEFVSGNSVECVVIRFKSNHVGNLYIPRNKNNGGILNDPDLSDPYNKNGYQFTGHGFTSGTNGRLGVPEWKMDSFADLQNGEAELYEVFSNGTEILRARFDKQLGQFVPVQ